MSTELEVVDFFNDSFKIFSMYDTVRSLPSIVDGLKISQRKILYTLTLRSNEKEIKVAQLGAQCAEKTDYHHGEGSLEGAIVGMAQDYTGSNNMNLLVPSGQFGSILSKDNAASRYIFTRLHDNYYKLFNKDDMKILEHNYSDDQKIEPKYFLPIIPTLLINGAEGIGTGFACKILAYNPTDIANYIAKKLAGKRVNKKLVPWYNGFKGTIERNEKQVIITGNLEVVNTTTIKITQLPIGTYTEKYRERLVSLQNDGFIKDFLDESSDEGFDITVICPRSTTALDHQTLLTKFKLITRQTENYTVWLPNGHIRCFDSVEDIIDEFIKIRLDAYEKRRLKLIEELTDQVSWLEEKMRFINFYLDNHDQFAKKKKDQLFKMLEKEGFTQIDRLLSERIYSLTKEKIDELKNKIKDVKANLKFYEEADAEDMYEDELLEFSF